MKTFFILCCLFFAISFSFSQNIIKGEYFIDTDLGFGANNPISVTASPDNLFPFSISLDAVAPGMHRLYIRTMDSNGFWSQTTSSKVEVIATSVNVMDAEYFIDVDQGFANNHHVSITASADNTFPLPVDLTGIAPGYHRLYIRTKDNEGKWSQTTVSRLEIEKAATSVISAEYFINADPGFGNAYQVAFAPSPDGTFSFNIPLENIPDSLGALYFRAKDSGNKRWSQTQVLRDSVVTSVATDSIWSHLATWSNHKIPDSNTIVILRHIVYVDIAGAVCRSLNAIGPQLPAPATEKLHVKPGEALKIFGY